MKSRLLWADSLKLIAIYLVIVGHVILMFYNGDYEDPICSYIYSFHMPLFMTLSGFFSYKLVSGIYDIKKKFKQLCVPCITLYILFYLMGVHTQNMWYLKALFLCYVSTVACYKLWQIIKQKNYGKVAVWSLMFVFVILLLIIVPLMAHIPYMNQYKVDYMLPYFVFGILIRMYKLYEKVYLMPILIFLSITALALWKSEYIWYNSIPNWYHVKDLYVNHVFVLDITNFISCFFRLVTGALLSFSLIMLSFRYIGERNSLLQTGGVK